MSRKKTRFELNTYHRNVPDEELLDDVREVSKFLHGKAPKLLEYRENGRFHDQTLCQRFGSWDAVLKQAGFEGSTHNMHITDEELFKNIEVVWIALGRQPSRRDMVKPLSKFSESPYRNRFNGWRGALEAFIDWVNETDDVPIDVSQGVGGNLKRTSRDPNLRQRFKVMKRDNFKCVKCGNSPSTDQNCKLHIDHILPWSCGGETTMENLQTLCSDCNLGKGCLEE